MVRKVIVAFFTVLHFAHGQVTVYEACEFPEVLGWEQVGSFGVDRWIETCRFHQLGDVPGDQDFYQRSLSDYAGVDSFFIEWRAESSIPSSVFDFSATPSALSAFGTSGTNYKFTFTEDKLRVWRSNFLPILFVDIEPGVAHTYRLEVGVDPSYAWFIDGVRHDSDIGEGPYPNLDSMLIWGGRYQFFENHIQWEYIRFGVLPVDGSGDFDSDGVVGPLDFPYFEECLLGEGIDAGPGCEWADFDFDSDVDCGDWGDFVALWNDPADPPALEQCCVALPYGDVDGSGAADLDDLTCMIDGLSGLDGCVAQLDISPCGGDGDVNLRDLLNLLDALAGNPACPALCP